MKEDIVAKAMQKKIAISETGDIVIRLRQISYPLIYRWEVIGLVVHNSASEVKIIRFVRRKNAVEYFNELVKKYHLKGNKNEERENRK